MKLYRSVPSVPFSVDASTGEIVTSHVDCVPGEPLCYMINRALQSGVSPDATIDPEYDDEADVADENETPYYQIDPSCDPRTDRFLQSEFMSSQREAASVVVPSEPDLAPSFEPSPAAPSDPVSEPV